MGSKTLWMYDCEFTWWDDGDLPYKKKNVKCLVAGYSIADVVTSLTEWYGDERIDSLSIRIIDDTENGIMEVAKEDAM